MGPLMINMAFMPLYMWEMWDVTPVTDEHTDTRTVESRAVFSLNWIRNKALVCCIAELQCLPLAGNRPMKQEGHKPERRHTCSEHPTNWNLLKALLNCTWLVITANGWKSTTLEKKESTPHCLNELFRSDPKIDDNQWCSLWSNLTIKLFTTKKTQITY